MKWYAFVNGFIIGALIVDDLILRYKLKRALRMRDLFNKKHLQAIGMLPMEAIGEISESASDLAYLKEKGFIR